MRPRIAPHPGRDSDEFVPTSSRPSGGEHASSVPRLEPHLGAPVANGDAEPVAVAVAEADGADVHVRLLLDEPGTRVPGAMDVVRVVPVERERVTRDDLPGRLLLGALRGASGHEERDAGESDEESRRPHGVTVARGAIEPSGYDWRSSRTRAFLPTRPRR